MKLHVTARAGGKTTRMLQWVEHQEHPDQIAVICHSKNEAERLRGLWLKKYDAEGAPCPRFITMGEARNGSLAGRHTKVVVDNLDIHLSHLLGYPVEYVTATGEAV